MSVIAVLSPGAPRAVRAADFAVAGAMLLIALLAVALAYGAHRWLAPAAGEPAAPFEHGARTEHETWVQFRVRWVVLALLFVAFDMEMVFMFPWAAVFRDVGVVAFADMFVFIAILASAIAFSWREGALDWER